jgi:hypothetical protein
MRVLGWLFILSGFGWITFVSLHNPRLARGIWAEEIDAFKRGTNKTSEDVFDGMVRAAEDVKVSQQTPLPGGIAMLAGVVFVTAMRKADSH